MSTGLTQTIENEFLTASVSGQTLRICSQDSGISFTVRALLHHPVVALTLQRMDHPAGRRGESLELTHPNGWRTSLALEQHSPFLRITTEITNTTASPWITNVLDFLQLQVVSQYRNTDLRVIGSGGLQAPQQAQGSYTFVGVAEPSSRQGMVLGWLTHERGVGTFFPQLGEPPFGVRIDSKIEFGHLQVNPGQSRPTETLLVGLFADARLGLEAYADAVAQHYGIRLRPSPGVYCTWYHGGASNEKEIARNTEFAARNLHPFGLTVMQIDDQWQRKLPRGFVGSDDFPTTGPVKVFTGSRDDNYPSGMAHTARVIASHGMVPGIWFMPFAGNFKNPYFDPAIFAQNPDGTPFHDSRWSGTCLDLTHPTAQAFVRDRVRRIHDWGYRYFKIDGMHTGLATYNIYVHTSHQEQDLSAARLHNPGMTHVEAYRQGLRILRETAPGTFVLGCNVSQNMLSMGPAFGMIDAMRIGPDNGGAGRGDWNQVTRGAWHGGNLYFLNRRVWHNDPDPVYVRGSNPLHKARWMCSWLAVSGSMHTSSELYLDLEPERIDLLIRCLPSHNLAARPVDYLETDRHRIWFVRNARQALLGLFNWKESESDRIQVALDQLDLDPLSTYVAFDYWEDRFLGTLRGHLDQTLDPANCRVLALRPWAPHPQVLSTSRHITQGLIDLVEEHWEASTRTLSGVSQVVAGDPYELRVALPQAGAWQVIEARAGEQRLTAVQTHSLGLRLRFTPSESRPLPWHIRFQTASEPRSTP